LLYIYIFFKKEIYIYIASGPSGETISCRNTCGGGVADAIWGTA